MTKKKKNARERRALVGALCTAAVIVAGSTFAWFTSTDEVTNRLSASADYDVKIVESFAPPENWIPGQDVDKDVYAVNTGNIAAYAKATVSGAMSITREKPVALSTVVTEAVPATAAKLEKYEGGSWVAQAGTDVSAYTAITDDNVKGGKVPANSNETETYGGPDVPNGATHFTRTEGTSGSITTYNDYVFYKFTNATSGSDASVNGIYDCVELSDNERYVIEAGAYLAYLPDADTINKKGNKVVAFNESGDTASENGALSNIGANNTTDFTPRADGLYVFRRSIVVDSDEDSLSAGTETFKYDGYYYFGGKYYKIANLNVSPDGAVDIAGDKDTTDGNLTGATADLVQEVKEYINPVSLVYDNANHRLIATCPTTTGTFNDTDLTTLASAVDEAEHNLAEKEVALRRALKDAGIEDAAVDEKTGERDAAKAAYETAKKEYDDAVAEYNKLVSDYKTGKEALNTAKNNAKAALTNLVGETGTISIDSAGLTDIDDSAANVSGNIAPFTSIEAGNATAKNAVDGTLADKYADALKAYNDFVASHVAGTGDNTEHIYYAYLQELAGDAGSGYTLPTEWQGVGFNPSTITVEQVMTEVQNAAETITYDYASAHVNYTTTDTDSHQFHKLTLELKLARENYQNGLQTYYDAMTVLNNAIDALGENGTFGNIDTTTDVGASDVDETALNPTDSQKYADVVAKYKDIKGDSVDTTDEAAVTGYTNNDTANTSGGLEGDMNAKKAALDAAEEALKNATNQVTGNAQVAQSVTEATAAYQAAKNALDLAEQKLAAAQKGYDADGDILIYIYLKNDAISGGTAKQWQILPTVVEGNQAEFYYTSILGAGQTSNQLIDYVELADSVTKDMYKYFDFDLNVKLDSAQVTYDDNNYITSEAVSDAFGTGVTANVSKTTDVSSAVVAWSKS